MAPKSLNCFRHAADCRKAGPPGAGLMFCIAGYAGITPGPRPPLDLMVDALAHRGPDDRGVWESAAGGVGLAQRGLTILGCPVVCASSASSVEVAGDAAERLDAKDDDALADAVERVFTDGVVRRGYERWGIFPGTNACARLCTYMAGLPPVEGFG